MKRALLKLIFLQARAVVRRSFRGARTVRGAIFLAIGAGLLIVWLASAAMQTVVAGKIDPQQVRTFFPLVMLSICVLNLATTAGERAIAFTPAEADYLFPGPFTRRELLLYKLARSGLGAIFTTTIFSLLFLRYIQHYLAGWIGIFLALQFLQLFSMSVVLIGEEIGQRAYTRGRKLLVAAVLAAVVIALLPQLRTLSGLSAADVAMRFTSSRIGSVLLAPFAVFGRIVTATRLFPQALEWTGAAVGINLLLLAIVMRLDAHYLEAAAASGQKVYARAQRMRRSGGIALRTTGSARWRLPQFPRLGGVGPIAWRQLTTALRQSRAILVLMLLMSAAIGPVVYFTGQTAGSGATGAWVGVIFWLTFMVANALRFDFRGDVDLIDTLKSLPVHPAAIVVAELVAPVLVLSICQLALLAGLAWFVSVSIATLLMVAAFAVPFNLLLFEMENLIFLLFPTRFLQVSPGDLQGFGRQMIVFMIRMIGLLVVGALAAGAGGIVYAFTRSLQLFAAVTCAMLAIESVAVVPLLVWAYQRYDVSIDTPA